MNRELEIECIRRSIERRYLLLYELAAEGYGYVSPVFKIDRDHPYSPSHGCDDCQFERVRRLLYRQRSAERWLEVLTNKRIR